MRTVVVVFALLSLPGCAQVQKEDLSNQRSALEAEIQKAVARLDQKITAVDTKYANMLALEQSVKNGLTKIDSQGKLLEDSNKVMTQIVQTQRNALREQLKSIEDQLEGLQKK